MIEVRHVSKVFNGFSALDDVSLSVLRNEMVALLGPSGSGKTTLLRVIAGLETATAGSVHFDDLDITGLSPRDRQVGFVFQHYALFRHMTVFDNIAFGLRVRPRRQRLDPEDVARRVNDLLSLVQLDGLSRRYPSQLSGGQRQRVALARALAIEPKVLLLDEPFGALDARVRKELRRWLRHLHDEMHITGVFVTHDQEEAMEVADRVVVMNAGRIEQIGRPDEIYDHPATPFVFQFLGNVNSLPCRVVGGRAEVAGLRLALPAPWSCDGEGMAFVRPHDFVLGPAGEGHGVTALVGHVTVLGPVVRIELELSPGLSVEAEISRNDFAELMPSTGVKVNLRPRQVRLFLQDGFEGTMRPLPIAVNATHFNNC